MNVLLTGGAGYIGSHTAVELLNRGCDIVIADDYSNSSPVAVERLRQITGRDFPAYHFLNDCLWREYLICFLWWNIIKYVLYALFIKIISKLFL